MIKNRYTEKTYTDKGTHVYWNRGGENILIYVDLLRLCNVTDQFPDLSIDILTNGITFTLKYNAEDFQ